MPDAFTGFLAAPSVTSFLRLRDEVLAQPEFEFASDRLEEVLELVEAGQFAAVADKVAELMPDWLLSPRLHLIAARAAEQLGDADRAQFEHDVARACLQGLRDSGVGSRASPYQVTHISDEYDLLTMLGKEFASQRQTSGTDGTFDVITCQDDSEVWFDITAGAVPPRSRDPLAA